MQCNKVFVSNIQRYSVHDGPGIRTVVFLLGCPLRCKWCQNPEAIDVNQQLMINSELCAGCAACLNTCRNSAISADSSGKIITDRSKCIKCWKCIDECYYGARQVSGKLYSADQVFDVVKKDDIVYKNTGGGLTLSGGEPTLHIDFSLELLKKSRSHSINTAVETCGYTKWENFEKIMDFTDLFLYDFKLFSAEKHKKWAGVDNSIIKQNLEFLVKDGRNIIIRIPLIPGVNDDEEEFSKMMDYVRSLKSISSVHIMPFHQLGSSKYEMLGIGYQLRDLEENNSINVKRCRDIAAGMGFKVSIGGAGFKQDAEASISGKPKTKSFLYKSL